MVGWAVWVWLPTAKAVAEFLAEEARFSRLPRGELDRLLGLARAAIEVRGPGSSGDGDGEAVCLGYYVRTVGCSFRVYVVVA